MESIPGISKSEYEVMKIVWAEKQVTASRIIEILGPKMNWRPRTIKTLINRLVGKQALDYTVSGKSYIYSPAVKHEDCIAEASESFLETVFDGALMPMLAYFAKSKKFTAEEIEKLKRILNEEE